MDYYGLLFLYYLKGLSGKSILRLFFNIEAGGTEQLLPENTSTPTTTPILADIQYPDGLRTDQYFTYRETPTTVSNKARIKTIKGQTLKWNQQSKLAQNWAMNYGGATVTRGDDEITVSNALADYYAYQGTGMKPQNGHVILVTCYAKANNGECGLYTNFGNVVFPKTSSSTYQLLSAINKETRSSATNYDYSIQLRVSMDSDSVSFKNPQIFDLTLMFGSTKAEEIFQMEQTTTGNGLAYFKQFFPLDFYPYNSGSLIPFMGNGIKTVGKNLLPFPYKDTRTTVANVGITVNDDGSIKLNGTANASLFFDLGNADINNIDILPDTYTLSSGLGKARIAAVKNSSYFATTDSSTGKVTFTITERCKMYFYITASSGTVFNNETIYPQFEFGTTATAYEPYTESVINLPISTYFPTGMKDVPDYTNGGTIYDELAPSKATTRIGSITLNGSEAWVKSTSYPGNYYVPGLLSDVKFPGPNAVSNRLPLVYTESQLSVNDLCFMFDGNTNTQNVNIKNTSMTTLDQFKAWLQTNSVTIYYELATPTETPIATEDANEALSLLMGRSVSSNNANQLIDIITKGE